MKRTFVDFDFGNLLALIKEVDGPAVRSLEKILLRKILLTDLIIAISEGIFQAARCRAYFILSDILPNNASGHASASSTVTVGMYEEKMELMVDQVNSRVDEVAAIQRSESEATTKILETLREGSQDMRLQLDAMMVMMGRLDILMQPTPAQAGNAIKSSVKRNGEQIRTDAKNFVPFNGLLSAGNRPESKLMLSDQYGRISVVNRPSSRIPPRGESSGIEREWDHETDHYRLKVIPCLNMLTLMQVINVACLLLHPAVPMHASRLLLIPYWN